MRAINRLIVHCSATTPSMDWGFAEIDRLHADPPFNFESPSGIHCGYHYVIKRDGQVEVGRPEHEQGAHAKRHNHDSIGICLIGGMNDAGEDEANFTKSQYDELMWLLDRLDHEYGPGLQVLGHRDLPKVAKACPCFDAPAFWAGRKEYVYG